MIKLAIPVLRVSDSVAAEDFYCRSLGFHRVFAYRPDPSKTDPCSMRVARDGVALHVSSFPGDGTAGGSAFLIVEDLDGLLAEFVAKAVAIALEPTVQTWGNREMYVKDPDGNTLSFVVPGSDDGSVPESTIRVSAIIEEHG